MKPIISVFLTILGLFLFKPNCVGQIEYGSNKGKYISINKTRLYYEEYGEGSNLLLIHGGIGSIFDFRYIIPELSQHFRVIAIDSPGHGRSEQADSLSYQLMADYLSRMIDVMDLDSVYVLGQSDGGNTALLLAHDRPDKVRRIVVSGANSHVDGLTEEAYKLFDAFSPQYFENQDPDWLITYQNKSPQKDKLEKFVHDIREMWLREVVISDSKLSMVESQVLVVMGDRDWFVKLEHGIGLYRAIKGSEFCVLPDTPHNPFKSRPDLINKIAISFLSSK